MLKPKPDKIWKFGTIGRKEPYKGTDLIVTAFKEFRRTFQNSELHIAFGSSPLHNPAEGIIVRQPHGDGNLARFYRELDVYICAGTLQYGAVHYPVIESMACGAAVITTPYYPATEENSWIVKAPTVNDILLQMETILKEPIENFTTKKLQALRDVQQFSWPAVAGRMLEIFESGLL
jgi:glycosyltransferase involved in cell wall biosynthesis